MFRSYFNFLRKTYSHKNILVVLLIFPAKLQYLADVWQICHYINLFSATDTFLGEIIYPLGDQASVNSISSWSPSDPFAPSYDIDCMRSIKVFHSYTFVYGMSCQLSYCVYCNILSMTSMFPIDTTRKYDKDRRFEQRVYFGRYSHSPNQISQEGKVFFVCLCECVDGCGGGGECGTSSRLAVPIQNRSPTTSHTKPKDNNLENNWVPHNFLDHPLHL